MPPRILNHVFAPRWPRSSRKKSSAESHSHPLSAARSSTAPGEAPLRRRYSTQVIRSRGFKSSVSQLGAAGSPIVFRIGSMYFASKPSRLNFLSAAEKERQICEIEVLARLQLDALAAQVKNRGALGRTKRLEFQAEQFHVKQRQIVPFGNAPGAGFGVLPFGKRRA